jgi:hypothetical protein
MKPRLNTASSVQAFTLAEALIASGILVILIGSVILCNLWGLSMSVREQIWLSSSDDAGKVLGLLYGDIRSSTSTSIGDFLTGTYVPAAASNQFGNALMIYPTTNTSNWVLYYYASSALMRTNYTGTGNSNYNVRVSANDITNDNPLFTAVDYFGNPLTVLSSTPVIKICLSFTKLQNPQVMIAPGSPVDFYQIITTIASRNRP